MLATCQFALIHPKHSRSHACGSRSTHIPAAFEFAVPVVAHKTTGRACKIFKEDLVSDVGRNRASCDRLCLLNVQ